MVDFPGLSIKEIKEQWQKIEIGAQGEPETISMTPLTHNEELPEILENIEFFHKYETGNWNNIMNN